MRISISKKALLICCVSLAACAPHPEGREPDKKGEEYNSYTEQIVENHRILREQMYDLREEAFNMADTLFDRKADSLMLRIDSIRREHPLEDMETRNDSLLVALGGSIFEAYHKMIAEDLRHINRMSTYPDENKAAIDSLLNLIKIEDSTARNAYENTLKQLNKEES